MTISGAPPATLKTLLSAARNVPSAGRFRRWFQSPPIPAFVIAAGSTMIAGAVEPPTAARELTYSGAPPATRNRYPPPEDRNVPSTGVVRKPANWVVEMIVTGLTPPNGVQLDTTIGAPPAIRKIVGRPPTRRTRVIVRARPESVPTCRSWSGAGLLPGGVTSGGDQVGPVDSDDGALLVVAGGTLFDDSW